MIKPIDMRNLYFLFTMLAVCAWGCGPEPKKHTQGREKILDVPFVKQEGEWYCGGAAVSASTRYYGFYTDQFEVMGKLFSKKRGGILNLDINLFLRAKGFWTKTITPAFYKDKKEKLKVVKKAYSEILNFIDLEHPVIVLLGPEKRGLHGFNIRIFILPVFWYVSDINAFGNKQINHYIVITGYDEKEEALICHDGNSPHVRIPVDDFLERWQSAGAWALVSVPPEFINWPLKAEEALDAGVILERCGNLTKALEMYTYALGFSDEKGPSFRNNVRFNMSNVYTALERYDEAEEILSKLKKADFMKGAVLNNLAEIFRKQGKELDSAQELIRTAISLKDGNGIYYMDTLAMVMRDLGRNEEACLLLEKAISLSSQENVLSVLWFHMGTIRKNLSDFNRAFDAFEKAADLTDEELEPERESTYTYEYAMAGLEIGQVEKARRGFYKVIALNRGKTGWDAKEQLKKIKTASIK